MVCDMRTAKVKMSVQKHKAKTKVLILFFQSVYGLNNIGEGTLSNMRINPFQPIVP